MRPIIVSNDRVLIDFAAALLRDAGIEAVVLDRHISVIEGSIGAFPQRLAVIDEDASAARRVLIDAELGQWLTDEADG